MTLQLKNFKIKNYRKFKEKEITFKSGLNIIYGENETGKSTISKALMTAFFADPTTRARKFFTEVKNWDEADKSNSTSNLPKLELTFEFNNKDYYLLKDFQHKEAVIESADEKERYEGISSFNEFVLKLFGFTSQDVYESSGFIKHEQLTNIFLNNEFYSAINNATAQLDTKENLHKVLDEIDKEIADMQKGLKGLAKNPGPIKYNMVLKQDLERSLAELQEKQDKVRIRLKNKREAAVKVKDLQRKIQNLEELLENNKKYEQATAEIKIIDQQSDRIDNRQGQLEDLDAQIVRNNINIEKFKKLDAVDLDDLIKDVRRINEEIKLREDTIKTAEFELKTISARLGSIKKDITIYIGGVFIVMGIILTVVFKNLLVGLVPLLGGIFMVIWQLYILFFSKFVKKGKELQTKLDNFHTIQLSAQNKLESILEDYGFSNVEDIYNAKATMISYATNIQNLNKLKVDLLENKDINTLRQEQTNLFLRKKEIEATVLTDEVKGSKLSPEKLLVKKRELDMFRLEEKKEQELLYASEADIKASSVSDEQVKDIEARLEQVEVDLNFFLKKLAVLDKTREFLSKAADDTAAMVSSIVKEDMEKYLHLITNDKYQKVKINEKFEIQIFEKDYKRWVKPEGNLSSGAIDQIYFLIRLAFFKLLLKKGNLFLVLDDPFVNFDAVRLSNAFEILKTEQNNYQILYFTNSKKIKEGNLITL